MTNPLSISMAVTKSPTASLLFYRVVQHSINLSIVQWIAQSHADWLAETGLSPKQLKKALADLKKADLIETAQHQVNGLRTLHVRLTKTGRGALAYADQ